MNTNLYIELSSTYRNRYKYPNPADFSVEISPSSCQYILNANNSEALNFISKSYPLYNFTGTGTNFSSFPFITTEPVF